VVRAHTGEVAVIVELGKACTATTILLDEVQPLESLTVTLILALPGLSAFQVMDLVFCPPVSVPWPVTDQV